MTRTKLASVGFVAARNCMRQQVLDDAKSLPTTVAGRSDSSYALNSARYYSVIQSTTPVLLQYCSSTTKYYSNYKVLLQYYKALLQYYSSTTKYYFSTTLYHKVLPLHYSVPQSTTPYYKALLQYYSILQSATPVLLRTTKYYSCNITWGFYYLAILSFDDSTTWRFLTFHCHERLLRHVPWLLTGNVAKRM